MKATDTITGDEEIPGDEKMGQASRLFDPRSVDLTAIWPKWQAFWEEQNTYHVTESGDKPKYYALDMFPYPSGEGLHVGHPKGYVASDVIARQKMLQGYNVLHPMGWDAFGLPAEKYAIKNKVHPAISTAKNVANYTQQLKNIGLSYDRSREVNTTDPKFYKWSQWIFLKLYDSYFDTKTQKAKHIDELEIPKHLSPKQAQAYRDSKRLAYIDYKPILWSVDLQTAISQEDLDENGRCEVSGGPVERRPMRQRVLRITDYADRLLEGLDKDLPERPENVKQMQRSRIGRSSGAVVSLGLAEARDVTLDVFTTRVDTLYGVTFVAIAPDHPLVDVLTTPDHETAVAEYVAQAKRKSDLERTDLNKDKSGVFTGSFVINPINGEQVPVRVGDYVLGGYGTGAVIGVPAHDDRDRDFAHKYKLPIKWVLAPQDGGTHDGESALTDYAILINSGEFTGLTSEEAKKQITARLSKEWRWSEKKTYRLQDRVFSRQRYRGEPIPMLHLQHADKSLPIIEEISTKQPLEPNKPLKHKKRGVAIVKHRSEDKYLVLEDKKNKTYLFPGPSVAKGETFIEASRRGIEEMTGYTGYRYLGQLESQLNRSYFYAPDSTNYITNQQCFVYQLTDDIFHSPTRDDHVPHWLTPEEVAKKIESTSSSIWWDVRNKKGVKAPAKALLIHGFEGSATATWSFLPRLADKLTSQGYDVVNLDRPNPEHPDHDEIMAFYGPIVTELDERSIMVGHSLGAKIATQLVAQYDLSPRAILLIAPAIHEDESWDREVDNDTGTSDRAALERMVTTPNDFSKLTHIPHKTVLMSQDDPFIPMTVDEVFPEDRDFIWTDGHGHFDETQADIIRDVLLSMLHAQDDEVIPLSDSDLPLVLPEVEHYEPTGTEEGPLANIHDWMQVTLEDGTKALRESNTMPQWAGSSRYRLRYMDPTNPEALVDPDKEKYRGQVDTYIGGMEHATRHLIYARFWYQFLFDLGVVSFPEPFKRLQGVGLVMAEDGRKMSKRRGNVVNPNDVIAEHGVDAFRTYEMFMGPFDSAIARSTDGVRGTKKFLEKVLRLRAKVSDKADSEAIQALVHMTIKQVTEQIPVFKYNTAISQMMILVNALTAEETVNRQTLLDLVVILSPFAPHLAEELWESMGQQSSIFKYATWPSYDESKLVQSTVTLGVQIGGKLRGTIDVSPEASEDEAMALVRADEKLSKHLTGDIKKIIYKAGKILNIVL